MYIYIHNVINAVPLSAILELYAFRVTCDQTTEKIFLKQLSDYDERSINNEMSHNVVYLFSIYDEMSHNAVYLFSTPNLGNYTTRI